MKKRTKILLTIAISLIVVITGVLGYAGNYFYTLAIDATSDKSVVFGEEDDPVILQNRKDAKVTFMQRGNDRWMTNKDGYKLHAYEAKQDSNQWMIVVHGYMGQGSDMLSSGNRFYDMGYNVLVPDLRSHGQSEGSKIGMGAWDSEDIVEWIYDILKEDPNAEIGLYGISMGASTVMMTTGHDLPDNVKVAIEDCGYTTAWDEFSYQLDVLFNLPSFPALDAANIVTKIRAGYDLKDADALEAVKKSKTPTLFIHGDADTFVPFEMLNTLYEAAAPEKDILVIKDAEHGKSKDVDPETYWKKVTEFIHKYMK